MFLFKVKYDVIKKKLKNIKTYNYIIQNKLVGRPAVPSMHLYRLFA